MSTFAALALLLAVLFIRGSVGTSFTIVHPKMFRIDAEETVLVNLHGYGDGEAIVTAQLTDYPHRRSIFSNVRKVGDADQPITVTVQVTREDIALAQTIENKKVELQVIVRGGFQTIQKNVLVYLTGETDYIFIQTERPIYRPGQAVQIRVIPLNVRMLPLKSARVEVTVQTPDRVGVWKREKNFPQNDFIEVTYPIPDDPPLGIWHVSVKVNNVLHTSVKSTEFRIDKYVLPTYDVSVELDQSYVKPGERIDGTLEAKYSYGEPVVGIYMLSASVAFPDSEELFEFYAKPSTYFKRPGMLRAINRGNISFSIPTAKAANVTERSWSELISSKATITVRVSILGQAEGILESDERSGILITNSPYLIDMSHTSRYFIPSRTHTLKIIVRDVVTKAPVHNVPVVIVNGGVAVGDGSTDDHGTAEVWIDTPRNENQIHLTIKTADSELLEEHQAEEDFVLTKYISRSGAYLRMDAPSHAAVDTTIHLQFFPYNARPREIQYMVLARGTIIDAGRKSVTGSEASQAVTITRKMSPGIRVVAYYMSGNEIISASASIDVSDVCHSQELEIEVNAESVKPDDRVTVSFHGEGGAMVGLSAVDRAAYFLFSEGRLNRDKMFEQMKSFDLGCSMSGGSDGFNVFQEAGLSCTGSTRGTPSVSELACPEEEERRKRRNVPITDREPRLLRRKCYKDGRLANLAGENCDIRKRRIGKWGFEEEKERICVEAFIEGCELGMFIRDTMEFRKNTQRTGLRVDRGSHAANVRRTRFLEGWLWGHYNLPNNGRSSKSDPAPHSITTYDIDAISVHDTEGFCVAKPAQVRVFKDFFIQLYLPYSVKVMEQVQIRAAVFNYHATRNRNVILRIKGDENLCTHSTPGDWFNMATLTVARQSSESFSFTVIPLRVPDTGKVTIEVESIPVSEIDNDAKDKIAKTLIVEDAGSQEEFSGSIILDPALSNSGRHLGFHFPDDNIVPGSKKCWIYGHMSFLGPIIEFDPIGETPKNLADSITLPHGCGEQNMFSVGPNAFAFKYLQSKGDRRASTRQKIQRFIIDGYTRQQSHRNSGKWSVYSHVQPTIWLNAYVNKVFLHARSVWPEMNMDPICSSLDWITRRQQADGRFTEQKLAHYYWINVAEGGDEALTAYVISAISETDIPCPTKNLNDRISEAKRRAAEYLRTTIYRPAIPYTSAIVAYALALTNPTHPRTNVASQRLMNAKIPDGDEIYWQGPTNTNRNLPNWYRRQQLPINIETTAYALLAQVALARNLGSNVQQSTVETINKIARWMVTQQNFRGGSQSSQTTAVAIQAITEYGIWINGIEPPPRNPNLNAVLLAAGTSWSGGHTFTLDEQNEFYRKEEVVPPDVVEGSRTVDVSVTGEGRGHMSYRCIYRVTRDSEVCDFEINPTTEMLGLRDESGEGEAEPEKGKLVMKLLLVISKREEPASSMSIVEVGFISGFRPVESTLLTLTLDTVVDGAIDRYEISDQKVIIYVEKIPVQDSGEEPLRIAFNFIREVEVDSVNPAKILVYDYYKPEDTCSIFYTVPDGLPMLRTSCAPSSIDSPNQQQCKCAEGGCPTCRTRNDQLEKTCGRRRKCYNACRNPMSCLNLHSSVCSRNYGFLAEITEVDDTSMPAFVKMTAIVKEVFRKSSDLELKTEQLRTFIIRKDCYDLCRDEELEAKSGAAEDGNYFIAGRTFLIRGRQPEKSVTSNSDERFTYYLDHEATIERTMTKAKCDKIAKKRNGCQNDDSDKCVQVRKRLKICDNQDAMRVGIYEGCD